MIKLCIFDLDGTVLDTVKSIAYYANNALIKNGIEPIPVEEYKYLAGNGISRLIHNMLGYRGCDSEEVYQRVYRDYDTAYNGDVTYKTEIFEGLKQTLDAIKAMGVRFAIVSNKPDFATRKAIDKFLPDSFHIVRGGIDGVPLKPSPDALDYIMGELSVTKDQTLDVGDSEVDVMTAMNAGISKAVFVTYGFRSRDQLLEAGAKCVVDNPNKIFAIIKTDVT